MASMWALFPFSNSWVRSMAASTISWVARPLAMTAWFEMMTVKRPASLSNRTPSAALGRSSTSPGSVRWTLSTMIVPSLSRKTALSMKDFSPISVGWCLTILFPPAHR